MKNKSFFRKTSFLLGITFAVLVFSCQTVKEVVGSPSLDLQSVGIKSLDLEGITFNCNYSITNPYPIAFSIKSLLADVLYDGGTFTKLRTDNGVSVEAMGTRTNSLNFKIPYTSILDIAKAFQGKEALPFKIDGSASLDLSAIPMLANSSLTLPFSKSFDVPVFKPEFSLSDVKLSLPTMTELRDSFINSGMSVTKAASLAAAILSGGNVDANDLADINLNLDLLMNLNVKNTGSSAWNFLLKNCNLATSAGNLANLNALGEKSISAAAGTVPLKVSINTVSAASLIADILNKRGTNPVFSFESGLSFPSLAYAPDIPLSYSKEIPLSSVAVKRN